MIVSRLIVLKKVVDLDLPSCEMVGTFDWTDVPVTEEDL